MEWKIIFWLCCLRLWEFTEGEAQSLIFAPLSKKMMKKNVQTSKSCKKTLHNAIREASDRNFLLTSAWIFVFEWIIEFAASRNWNRNFQPNSHFYSENLFSFELNSTSTCARHLSKSVLNTCDFQLFQSLHGNSEGKFFFSSRWFKVEFNSKAMKFIPTRLTLNIQTQSRPTYTIDYS